MLTCLWPLLFSFSKQAKALLQTASSLAPHMYEPHFNFATISDKVFSFFINLSSDLFVFFVCVCVCVFSSLVLKIVQINEDILTITSWEKWFFKHLIIYTYVFILRESLIHFKYIYHWILAKLNTIMDCRRIILCFKRWHLIIEKLLINFWFGEDLVISVFLIGKSCISFIDHIVTKSSMML